MVAIGPMKQRSIRGIMRIIACALLIALAAISMPLLGGAQQTAAPASESNVITVRMSNFAFDPDHLRLRRAYQSGFAS